MVALLALQIDCSFPLTTSSKKLLLCGWVPGIQKQTWSPPPWSPQDDKHYDIRKYRVTGKHGKSEHLSQTCHLQDDCSYTISTASLVLGVSQQNSSTVFPDVGYLDSSFPDQTGELDSLCTLTCFHIVGIG